MKRIIKAVTVLVLLSKCYPARMALPGDAWPAKEEYKVEGKRGLFSKERMRFGEYYTTDVKRSWTKGSSRFGLASGAVTDYDYTNIISLDLIRKKQTAKFSLTDAASRYSEVYCVSRFSTEELVIGNRPNSLFNIGIGAAKTILEQPDSKYYVQIYTKAGEKPRELLLDNVRSQLKRKSYVGYLSLDKNNYYTLQPVWTMEGKDGKPGSTLAGTVGFEIRNKEGRPVAAVSLLNKGAIYLQSNSAEEKFLLANACAALLMQEEIG